MLVKEKRPKAKILGYANGFNLKTDSPIFFHNIA
jgi:hypothetical protein